MIGKENIFYLDLIKQIFGKDNCNKNEHTIELSFSGNKHQRGLPNTETRKGFYETASGSGGPQ